MDTPTEISGDWISRALAHLPGDDAADALTAAFISGEPIVHPQIAADLFLGDFPAGLHPYRFALPGLRLRAVKAGGEWLVSHSCDGAADVFWNDSAWPSAQVRRLGDKDEIQLGPHRVDRDSLEQTAGWENEMPLVRSIAESAAGDVLLCETCEPDHLALLRYDQGFSLAPLSGRELWVNGESVSATRAVFPSDRIELGRFRGQAFELIRRVRECDGLLELEHVTKRFPDGAIGLRDLTLRLQTGDFVAIMGPSGSGKSTLLDVITGASPASEGAVRTPGFEGRIAMVPQDDVLFETLTVEENLRHAGRLRTRACEEDIQRRIDEVLPLIGLEEKRKLRAGSDLDKTLSGGQRRRLSIGLELMGSPRLLILDEPTSGLSGPDASSVVGLLRNLARRGTLVIATIHQPSADVYARFDKLIVLDRGGVLAYFGYAAEAAGFLTGSGGADGGPEPILGTIMKSERRPGDVAESRLHEPDHWGAIFAERRAEVEPPLILAGTTPSVKTSTRTRGWLGKLACVTRRETARKLKDWRLFLNAFALTALLGSLIAIVCRQGDDYDYAANKIIPSYAFLAVILSQFLAASAGVGELVKDRRKQLREKLLDIGGGTYVLSKLPFLLLLTFLQAGIITYTGYRILEIPAGAGGFWLMLGTAGFTAAALGLLVSSLPRMTETKAMAAVPLLLIPQIVLAGAEPFVFTDLKHLHWPKGTEAVEKAPEDDVRPPWISAPIPSRWAYEGTIAGWTTLPIFREIEEAKAARPTLNFFKRHRREFQENRPAFDERYLKTFGQPFDHSAMERHIALLARCGILSGKDVTNTYLLDYKKLAPAGVDLDSIENSVLKTHARDVVAASPKLFGKEVRAVTRSFIVLGGIGAAALLLAVVMNRRALRQRLIPRLSAGVSNRGDETENIGLSAPTHAVLIVSESLKHTISSAIGRDVSAPGTTAGRTPMYFVEDGQTIPEGAASRVIHPATDLARSLARQLSLPLTRGNATEAIRYEIVTDPLWLPALGNQLAQISQSLARKPDGAWHSLRPELHFLVPTGSHTAALDDSLAHLRNSAKVTLEESRSPAPARPEIRSRQAGDVPESFNPFADLVDHEWTVESPYERLARQIHIEYSRVEAADRREENDSPAVGAAWEALTETYRGYSRESATHLIASAQGLGFSISPPSNRTADNAAASSLLASLSARMEELAACEHYRWMAGRVLGGWTYGPVRNDELKQHPDLLPYEGLAESTKEKDRACVRALAVMVQHGVFHITAAT